MVDLKLIKQHLNIDADITIDDEYLSTLNLIVEEYVNMCVGTAYKAIPAKEKLADILKLRLITDMYENRSTTVENDKRDRIVTTLFQALSICEATS